MKADAVTEKWIRNRSDEIAVDNGCRFSQERADHILDFLTTYLRLYEGDKAMQPFEPMEWQVEVLSRVFGWERYSGHHERWIRRFNKASVWVPKKNGKTPTGAAVGLYLLVHDGEKGQKVYSAAKDGKQAGRMHKHAQQMVMMSPALNAECSINKTTGMITFEPTQSTYEILSGDNIKSQEGLNGSVVIDETHVVDARLASVLRYMGISRSEPMQFEISTAGIDPEGYGKQQYDHGKQVESGDVIDQSFFFCAYEAPQDVGDADCGNPDVWRMANPAMEVTVNEEELRDSYEQARRSRNLLNTFKMYRLNVWSTGISPWLNMDEWRDCAEQFSEDDFEGEDAWLGLDMAKKDDMSSMVFMFQRNDRYWMLPRFYMPEDTVRDKQGILPYDNWADRGYLQVTPGNTVDDEFILSDFLELSKKFNVQKILFDFMYAESISRRMSEESGVEREEFRQTILDFATPTAAFERMLKSKELAHNNHPVLNWHAGNANVKRDVNDNIRPVKPPEGNNRKIDGIVAAIMALSGAMEGEQAVGGLFVI